jgi:N-methylhydantoinase A
VGLRVGVDIGGTFTDAVCIDEAGGIRSAKALSTPGRLADGVVAAVERLGVDLAAVEAFTHGTTAGLNAFLERRGARVALLTTAGFRDVYEIGRANRPAMYDVRYRPPAPLVPRRDVFEVPERLAVDGSEVAPVDEQAVLAIAGRLPGRFDAVAVCLLHAYANPAHERTVARLLAAADPDLTVVCSSEVAPEWREYERTSTTVLSAYVAPVIAAYLDRLERRLVERGLRAPLRVMQSNGGVMTAATARGRSVQTLFSGPVGGTIAGVAVAAELGMERLICVDMGGTSFDVSLVIDGQADVEAQVSLDGHPVLSPAVAIHTIGAGGGSVAHVAAGGLRVGPRSAGAEPGPACYGAGGAEPTVTDANLLLGRLPAAARLGGSLALDPGPAAAALAPIAGQLGLDPVGLAGGIVAVADAAMANAIRELTVARGIDPRDFSLLAFGGAGPLHAVALAEELELGRVVVPADPGVLSAWGMLQADTRHDLVQSFFAPVAAVTPEALDGALEELAERARQLLKEDGVTGEAVQLEPAADLRYVGQEYTVTVPILAGRAAAETLRLLPGAFAAAHLDRYGHNNPGEAIECVNLRMTAIGRAPAPPRAEVPERPPPRPVAVSEARFAGGTRPTPVYRRADLGRDAAVRGPCVLLEDACTTLVPPGWLAACTRFGHLLLERSR